MGGAGHDKLLGGSGNDVLTGGRGRDVMTGGTGRDSFAFDDRDTAGSRSGADYITDFSGRAGDRLNLKLVDANAATRRDDTFSFIGEAAFTKAGQVRYEHVQEKGKWYTYVSLNTDADSAAEAVIKLKGSIDLVKGWFVL